jgi:hypothetical protein
VAGSLEGEVRLADGLQPYVDESLAQAKGQKVIAYGVWVDDVKHDSKTELHPLDALTFELANLPAWVVKLKDQLQTDAGKEAADTLRVYRIIAATDKTPPFPESIAFKRCPYAGVTRPLTLEIPVVAQPRPNWRPEFLDNVQRALKVRQNTIVMSFNDDGSPVVRVELVLPCDEDGGPAGIIQDIATWWDPRALEVAAAHAIARERPA